MGYKTVTDLDAEFTTALGGVNKKTGKANPKQAEGYYLGSRQVESKKSKTGLAYVYYLQTAKGNLGIWGKTDLDKKMRGIEPGVMVRITQTSMVPTPNGDMYKFAVEFDDSNTIEVVGATAASAEEVTDEDIEADLAENQEEYASNFSSAQQVTANAAVAMSASERQAKVQELLKKRK